MSRFETTCPACGRSFKNSHVEMRTFCSVGCQVDDGERKFWDGKSVNHHPGCSVHDDGHCTCGYRAERETLERSPSAPGEGTWSVFAAKVVRQIGSRSAYEQVLRLCDERDELRRTVARLTDEVAELRKQLTQETENP